MNSIKEHIIDVQLELLPGYANYLLSKKLKEFVKILYQYSKELNIPLLKFFEGMDQEEFFKLSTEGNIKLLTAIKDGKPHEYVEYSKNNWLRNQLPIISKEDVIVEDISLINYARKKALREFLPLYISDSGRMLKIIDEIDRFILSLDSVLFKTYIGIQEEKLKLSNDQLRKREQELLEAQSLGKIGSFEWDLTGNKKSSFTPEVYKIFEMEKTSNLESFLNDVHPEDRLKLQAAIEKAMHDGLYECEYRYNRKNIPKVLYSRGRVFFQEGKPLRMVGTVTDVTEKANLIKQLLENEELSKQAQALTNTGSWKWVIDNDVIEWSDEMYRIYGLEPQSEKITFQRFLTFIHDDDRNRRISEITEAIKKGTASDYIMRIVTNNGQEKILKGKGHVIVGKEGKSIGMLGTCQDITNEHNLTSELKTKNEELLRKNRDLEAFNFIASHDLQEPLRKIQLYSNRITHEGIDTIPEHLLKYFTRISQASNRMQKMIEDFLVFYQAMNTVETTDELDLKELVSVACADLHHIIGQRQPKIDVQQMAAIKGSKKHITEMLKHLVSNAIKFTKKNEAPEITITSKIETGEDKKQYTAISVGDKGIGFDQKYSTRIFELFQRLHGSDEYTGSGIGLSLCKKIAEDHKGFISVVSQPGAGSTFTVYLPAENI